MQSKATNNWLCVRIVGNAMGAVDSSDPKMGTAVYQAVDRDNREADSLYRLDALVPIDELDSV